MAKLAIKVDNLGKEYRIGAHQEVGGRLSEQVVRSFTAPLRRVRKLLRGEVSTAAELGESLWALRDVTFEIRRGEAVGVIGPNGAGKSTLLKVLSRITEPTEGSADIYGRVGSLLEVGTGFHPELTGRENTYLNGAILGMRKQEVDRKFDGIVAFAGLDKFIDTPIKHYSSGMYVRLAFSVAAHLEPEILLVDEVLAVGDIEFQRKCLGKMEDVSSTGRTVVFISHNMGLIQTLCRRGIFLKEGRIMHDGPVEDAVNAYLNSFEQVRKIGLADRTDRTGSGEVRLTAMEILGPDGSEVTHLQIGQPVKFVFHTDGMIAGLACVFTFHDNLGRSLIRFVSSIPAEGNVHRPDMKKRFICEIDHLPLLPGDYRVDVALHVDRRVVDSVPAAAQLDVVQGFYDGRLLRGGRGIHLYVPHRWQLPG